MNDSLPYPKGRSHKKNDDRRTSQKMTAFRGIFACDIRKALASKFFLQLNDRFSFADNLYIL